MPLASGEAIALLPAGTGILNVGGDALLVRDNVIHGNDTVGLGLLDNPFAGEDPRLDAPVDDNEIRDNLILGNGGDPDTSRPIAPGVDVFVGVSGTGNCFEGNVIGTETPEGVVEGLPCSDDAEPGGPSDLIQTLVSLF